MPSFTTTMSNQQADTPSIGPEADGTGADAPAPSVRESEPGDALGAMADTSVNRYLVVMVLVAGLLLTGASAFLVVAREQAARDVKLDDVAAETRRDTEQRYARYSEVLVGLRALMATGTPTSDEFDDYVDSLTGQDRFPGTLALGFAPKVAPGEVAELERVIRRDGSSDFEVVEGDGSTGDLFPVVLLNPIESNEGMLGFDLVADPRGRAVIEQASSTGEPTMGGPLVVLTEDGTDERAVNLYLPVYEGGGVPDDVEDRNDRLDGVVFMIFSPERALAPFFGENRRSEVELYDLGLAEGAPGLEPTERNLLFDTRPDGYLAAIEGGSRPDQRLELVLGGRRWLLYVSPGPGFPGSDTFIPWVVVMLGLVITGLLVALLVSFARTRSQAAALAQQTTAYLLQREAELERANEDIVRSNKELERYASIAAHDLQEPLRSLLAYASVLERRYGETLEPEVLDQIQRMGRAAERMRSLVVDLLAYARADSEQRQIEMVDLNEAVRIAIDDLSVLIHESGATIRVAQLPEVPGNRRELIGVFSNLLSNALKYRSESPPEVVVVAHHRGSEWIIGVRDNGLGIAPAYHERIFELFRRLEKRSTDSGTGLGLAICARTVAQHGGRIWVESEEGAGATFWFTLPVEAPPELSGVGR